MTTDTTPKTTAPALNAAVNEPQVDQELPFIDVGAQDGSQVKLFAKFIFDVVLENPKQLIFTLILSILSTAAQIGLAFYVFRLVQSGGSDLSFLSVSITGQKLWVIPIFLAIAAAFIPYFAERYIISETVVFFKKSIRDIAKSLSDTQQRYKLFVWAENNSVLTRLMSSDARYASLAFAGILRLVFPITLSITSLTVLCFINLKWTIGLILLLIPFLIWQLRVVISGAALNRELRRAGQAHGQAAAKYVGALSTHFTANRRGETLIEAFDHSITDDFPNAYGERLRLGISTRLVGDFAIVGLILLICGLVITGNFTLDSFSHVLIYAIVVRFAMTNLSRAITGTISIISQVPFYENYVSAKNALSSQSDISEQDEPSPLKLAAPFDAISPNELQVVFSGAPLSWILIFKFLIKRSNYIFALRSVGQTLMASGGYRNFSNDFTKELQMAPLESERKFLEVFPNSAHRWADFNQATSHAKHVDNAWIEIPRPIKFLCSLNFAHRKKRGGSFVFVNGADYLGLTAAEKDWVRDLFKGTHLILVFNRIFAQKLVLDVKGYYLMTSDGNLYRAGESDNYEDVLRNVKRLFEYEKGSAHRNSDLSTEPFSEL